MKDKSHLNLRKKFSGKLSCILIISFAIDLWSMKVGWKACAENFTDVENQQKQVKQLNYDFNWKRNYKQLKNTHSEKIRHAINYQK